MLTDAAVIGASLWTLRLVRRPGSGAVTYGFRRAEVLSAAVNGITLAAAGLLVLVEAVNRLITPAPVTGWLLPAVAGLGVVVNAAATVAIGRADSIASLLVVALVARAALPLLRFTGRILLEGAPEGVDLTWSGPTSSVCPTCGRCTTCTPGWWYRTCRPCPTATSTTRRLATRDPAGGSPYSARIGSTVVDAGGSVPGGTCTARVPGRP